MKKNYFIFLFIFTASAVLFSGGFSFAKTDLSISETDITLSNDAPLNGDTIRIFVRVFNVGDTDVLGYVVFLLSGKEMAAPQPISVKANTYDDVFIDWQAKTGVNNIEAKITGLNLADDNLENNKNIKKEIFIDLDTDGDKIGDKNDPDDDNDGVLDADEIKLGADPLKADTDGDGVKDNVDVFPKDKIEWRDTDQDGLGDNKDLDDDNDGIFDFEEIYELGTNSLNPDTDQDGSNDKQEIEQKTDPKKADTDSDGVNDSVDRFPLDASRTGVSLNNSVMVSVAGLLNSENAIYLLFGGPLVLLVLFFLFRKKRRRRH